MDALQSIYYIDKRSATRRATVLVDDANGVIRVLSNEQTGVELPLMRFIYEEVHAVDVEEFLDAVYRAWLNL